MTLFQERQASAKKVVALQNEIITLKTQLQNINASKVQDCSACEKQLAEVRNDLDKVKAQLEQLLAAQSAAEQDKPSKRRGRQPAQDKQEEDEDAV